jgi:DNA-binding NarL/FixJ family response regulator
MTISLLLVDDAPEVRTLLRVALRVRGGFTVVGEAETGAAALEVAAAERPDVIVLDLGLPDLAARDLLGQIRRVSPTSRVVIFSGNDDDRRWFEERSASYVFKDEELERLVDVVAEVGSAQYHDTADLELPEDPGSPAEARELVRDLLERWGRPELVEDAALVVSELVANAVEHARSSARVAVRRSDGGIRIEVRDDGHGTPDLRPPDVGSLRGRGLRIISSVCTAWGVITHDGSKTVWAEVGPA